jgi:outer membrane protein assembly factor BamB
MKKNTLAILCGHGHGNHAFSFDGIPGVMGRSNLRSKAAVGGYNLVSLDADSMYFTEKRPSTDFSRKWTAVNIHPQDRSAAHMMIRPSYAINDTFSFVKPRWTFSAPANIASTPAVTKRLAFVGDLAGTLFALHIANGSVAWKMQTGGSIFSSPAVADDQVVFGSGDGNVYCLQQKTGELKWKFATKAAVLASPLIANGNVFIASSDHSFRCIDVESGKLLWEFNELNGSVVSTPVLSNGNIIFGSWDTFLYSLNAATGMLVWKWSNGSSVRNLSPASCIPIVKDGVVYIVAPDRFITAIDEKSGTTLWRSNESTVRESMGVSDDGRLIYGKTMQDTVVAFATGRTKQPAVWKMHVGFGYEHVPSMLKEKDGAVFFGTRNGVVYSIDPKQQKTNWAYKVDNSMINTVRPLDNKNLVATTMDGKVVLLQWKK